MLRVQSTMIDTSKLGVPVSLVVAILNAGKEQVQGVDSNRSALVYVKKINGIFAAGIRYEVPLGGSYFTMRHDQLFADEVETIAFFSEFNLGEITWIKNYPPSEYELLERIRVLEAKVQ